MKQEFIKSVTTNNLKENEFLAYLCLSENNVKKLQDLIADGLPVTAFMLTLMEHFGCSKETIKETLTAAVDVRENVFLWVKDYFDTEDARVIIQKFEAFVSNYLTTDDYIRFELWQTLFKRKCYVPLAEHNPDFLLKQDLNREIMEALLKVNFDKYVDLAFEKKMYFVIFCAKDGWKYLVDKEQVWSVFRFLNNSNIIRDNYPLDEILEYCYRKGLTESIYNAGYYDFLLSKRQFNIFVKRHSLYEKFLTQYPQHVDWEDLWVNNSGSPMYLDKIKEMARMNKTMKVCRDFLSNHSTFWERLLFKA